MELLSIKDKLIEVTENINSETTFDDIMERMFLIYKIEKGLQQVNAGQSISHSELKNQVLEWKR
ncbi:MAG: hypothetical protein HW421_1236 [Ignavibacteria bacterium]|nr:hypothetical protein [Ignavibacteria bacterium]